MKSTDGQTDSPVTGAPRLLLRLEGLAVLVASVAAYHALGASWTQFALLFLLPDLALAGYLAGPRVGAVAYNALHTWLSPFLLAVLAALHIFPEGAWLVALIWAAHIGMDRVLGLGLKYASAFGNTHLGIVGLRKPHA
jgi:hypothetical protein